MLRPTLQKTAATATAPAAKKCPKPLVSVRRVVKEIKQQHDALKQAVLDKLADIEAPLADVKSAYKRASDERAVNVAKVTASINDAVQAEVHFGMECVQDVRSEIVKYLADDDLDDETTDDQPPVPSPVTPDAPAPVPCSCPSD